MCCRCQRRKGAHSFRVIVFASPLPEPRTQRNNLFTAIADTRSTNRNKSRGHQPGGRPSPSDISIETREQRPNSATKTINKLIRTTNPHLATQYTSLNQKPLTNPLIPKNPINNAAPEPRGAAGRSMKPIEPPGQNVPQCVRKTASIRSS